MSETATTSQQLDALPARGGGATVHSQHVTRSATRLGIYFFLLFYFGAFGVEVASLLQLILTGAGVYVLFVVAISSHTRELIFQCWPLLVQGALAIMSIAWTVDTWITTKRSITLIIALLLGFAVSGLLRASDLPRALTRLMSLLCVMSVLWIFIFPDTAIHQQGDAFQSVHAGLWRGVFGHKVNHGYFAGMTFALLAFYGWRVFPVAGGFLVYLIALTASILCVMGAGSATGYTVAVFLLGMLWLGYLIARQSTSIRVRVVRIVVCAALVLAAIVFLGVLDQFASLVGRSTDLTGRTKYWPYVYDYVLTGSPIFGYGYFSGFRFEVGPNIAAVTGIASAEAHNGFLEVFVAFGIVGSVIVTAIYLWLFRSAALLVIQAPPQFSAVSTFPLAMLFTLLLVSYVESVIMMPLGIWTIVPVITASIIVKIKRSKTWYVYSE